MTTHPTKQAGSRPWRIVSLGCLLLAACGSKDTDRSAVSGTAPPAESTTTATSALAPPWRVPPSADAQGACVDCHARIATDWSRTGMARSLGPVAPGEMAGLAPVEERPTGYRYSFELQQGVPSIVETRPDDPAHRLSAELALGIGSGERDRAFAAVQGDLLWFAPLEVVTTADGTRHAAMAPGHTIQPGSRFTSPLTPECLGCHTDALPRADFPLNQRAERLASGERAWEPRGISCGSCHGPVERHARLRQEEIGAEPADRLSQADDPVLRAGSLSRIERLSLCAACHLQGDARILLDPGQLGPPRPGGDLLERRALFVAARPTSDVGFVSQVERLVLSPCFLESDSMDCTTCHDPHRTLHDEPERRRVRDGCFQCHPADQRDSTQPAHATPSAAPCAMPVAERPPSADCASCHMRRTGVFDVEEVEIHDHFIQRDPGPASPKKPLRAAEDPNGDWVRFTWPGEAAPKDVDDAGLWMMAAYGRKHFELAAGFLDQPASPRVERLPMYHHVRGSLLEAAGRIEDARAAYEQALRLNPDHAPSAINLGLLLGNQGDPRAGVQLLTDLLTRFPNADTALRNRAVLQHKLGDLPGLLRDLEAAQRVHPDPAVAATLAALAEQAGDRAAAQKWRQAARALDPLGQPPVR